MENVFVINGSSVFTENAIVLANKFKIELVTEFSPKTKEIYIVFGAHDICIQLFEAQKNTGFVCIIMDSDQIGLPVYENKFYIQLMKNNTLFDYNHFTSKY